MSTEPSSVPRVPGQHLRAYGLLGAPLGRRGLKVAKEAEGVAVPEMQAVGGQSWRERVSRKPDM